MLSEAERLIVRLGAYIATLEQSHMELQKQNKELQEKLGKKDLEEKIIKANREASDV